MSTSRIWSRPLTFQDSVMFTAHSNYFLGLPRWLSGKESTCSAGDMGSISGSGRSPGEGSLGNLMYRGTWWAAVLRVAKESDTTTSDYPLPDSFEILKITKKNFLQVCSFDVPLNKNEVPQGIQLILSNLFLRELFLPSLGKEILTNWECE